MKEKLQKIVTRVSGILSEHAKASGFVPIGLELGFGGKGPLPPLTFQLKNGCTMELVGRIDRVDEKKLGIEVTALALINLSPLNRETIHSFLEDINKFPQVQECYTLTGSHDYMLKIVAKDMEKLCGSYFACFIERSITVDITVSSGLSRTASRMLCSARG